jgi:hypothetical protein
MTFFDFEARGEHVSRSTKRCNLTCENFIEATVCGRSEKPAIARETNRRLRGPIFGKPHLPVPSQNAMHQLRCRHPAQ